MRELAKQLRRTLVAYPPARLRSYVLGCRCAERSSVYEPHVLSVDCPIHGSAELRQLVDDVRANREELFPFATS